MRAKGIIVTVAITMLVMTNAWAGGFVLDSIFAQVYSEKVTVVDAGVSTYATYHAELDGPVTGVAPNPGNVTALCDRFNITAETRWLKIVTVVKDVKGNRIIQISQAFMTPDNERTNSGLSYKIVSPYEIWVDTWSLPPFIRFTPVVVQNASKKDHRILWVFTITSHFRRENSADVFITSKDISDELARDLIPDQPQLGLTLAMLEDQQRPEAISRLFRAYVYERYPVQLTNTSAPYAIKADGRAQRVQGQLQDEFRAEIAKLTAAYEQKINESRGVVDELIKKLQVLEEARKAAEQKASEPFCWSLRLPAGRHMLSFLDMESSQEVAREPVYGPVQLFENATPGRYYVQLWQGEKTIGKIRILELERSCNLVFDQLVIKEGQ